MNANDADVKSAPPKSSPPRRGQGWVCQAGHHSPEIQNRHLRPRLFLASTSRLQELHDTHATPPHAPRSAESRRQTPLCDRGNSPARRESGPSTGADAENGFLPSTVSDLIQRNLDHFGSGFIDPRNAAVVEPDMSVNSCWHT